MDPANKAILLCIPKDHPNRLFIITMSAGPELDHATVLEWLQAVRLFLLPK